MSCHGRNVHAACIRRQQLRLRLAAEARALALAQAVPVTPQRPGFFARILAALGF
jgi:hypothetical protein